MAKLDEMKFESEKFDQKLSFIYTIIYKVRVIDIEK